MGNGSFEELIKLTGKLLVSTGDLTLNSTWHALRYVLPFLIYPIIVYFTKLALYASAESNETPAVTASLSDECYYRRQFQQSTLITWTLKVIIMIFVFFNVLDLVGVKTGDMLEITTVFSLGLSWSMRDWLSSMWGCFMLAFCTDLTIGTCIKQTGNAVDTFTVCAPGLMFVYCQKNKTNEYIYIPNSNLVTSGFVIAGPLPSVHP